MALGDDGITIELGFTGKAEGPQTDPCNGAYEAEVDERHDQVIVTVYGLRLVEPPSGESDCNAMGHERTLVIILAEPLEARFLVDGHTMQAYDQPANDPSSGPPVTTQDEVMSTTTSGQTSDEPVRLVDWVNSVRFEPWYDGFQFDGSGPGESGVLALDPDVPPPSIPSDLPVGVITSRMGQREWQKLVPSLADEMNALDVVGLSYDPFDDVLIIVREQDPKGQRSESDVAKSVRELLGDRFTDIETRIESGAGPEDSFQSPPTTRG